MQQHLVWINRQINVRTKPGRRLSAFACSLDGSSSYGFLRPLLIDGSFAPSDDLSSSLWAQADESLSTLLPPAPFANPQSFTVSGATDALQSGVSMPLTTTAPSEEFSRARASTGDLIADQRSLLSAVSWGAIAAGAAATASLSLILLILGVGLGLSSMSPWAREGVSAATFGVSTILWLTLTQLLASAMGGYLAGRLRTKWSGVHTDEVYFRDTAHGFLAWAVATLATAALLTSVIGSIVNGGVQAGAAVAGGAAGSATSMVGGAAASGPLTQGSDSGPWGYFVDSLFRRDPAATGIAASGATSTSAANERTPSRDLAEVSRIFMSANRDEPLPPEDLRYVGQIVAQRTGMAQQDAEKRVDDVYSRAKTKLRNAEVAAREAADKARKASAYAALWLFVSLLIGAFVASLAATYGGRRRDA
jgi:hypothetical protein